MFKTYSTPGGLFWTPLVDERPLICMKYSTTGQVSIEWLYFPVWMDWYHLAGTISYDDTLLCIHVNVRVLHALSYYQVYWGTFHPFNPTKHNKAKQCAWLFHDIMYTVHHVKLVRNWYPACTLVACYHYIQVWIWQVCFILWKNS